MRFTVLEPVFAEERRERLAVVGESACMSALPEMEDSRPPFWSGMEPPPLRLLKGRSSLEASIDYQRTERIASTASPRCRTLRRYLAPSGTITRRSPPGSQHTPAFLDEIVEPPRNSRGARESAR